MRGRVAVHVSREADSLVLAFRDPRTRAAVTIQTSVRAGATLSAQLWIATSADSADDGHDSEAEFRGAIEVTKP